MFSVRSSHYSKCLAPSFSALQCLLYSSTAAASNANRKNRFAVDFLINTLGFSEAEAISKSKKLNRLKSAQNPDSVIELFKRYGFEQPHIKSVVYKLPQVLSYNPDKTLEPKLLVLREHGLIGSDLVRVIRRCPGILMIGLDTHIRPVIRLLREVLGSDENVAKALNRSSWLLTSTRTKESLPRNMQLLRDCGLADKVIGKLLVMLPRLFLNTTERLRDVVHRVEEELHVPRDSAMFFYGIQTLFCVSKPVLELKFGIFRSFGWSDSDIYTMGRNQPRCLSVSEARLGKMLNFFMKEQGLTAPYLASQPTCLMMSLEKRVKPRVELMKILEDSNLVNFKWSILSVLSLSESKFLDKCILRYEKEIPNLFENYAKILKKQ